MQNHELNLLENAIDSFNEALRNYQEGEINFKSYKFAILNFSHFIELLLKHYVSRAHPLLIYKNPFSDKIKQQSTIGLWEAVQFIKNEEKTISKDFESDLKWIKKLRNEIEHYEFKMELSEVKETIGRLTKAIIEFIETYIEDMDLETYVHPDNMETFEILADEYKTQLAKALSLVDEANREAYRGIRPKFWDEVQWNVYTCPECEHETLMTNHDSPTGYRCTFCKNEKSEEIEVNCSHCDLLWPTGDMSFVEMEDGAAEPICPRCGGDPDYVDD
jgi:ribosomal protein S27AE